MSRKFLASIGCVLALLATGYLSSHAAESGAKEPASIDFKGKVLLLIIDRSGPLEKKDDSEYISDAVLQKLGDRYFVTGNAYTYKDAPGDRHDWRKGAQVGIAWEKVQQYYVYSPERIDEIMKKRYEDDKE